MRSPRTTPSFAGVSYEKLERWARCSGRATRPRRTARRSCIVGHFVRGKGHFVVTEYVPTDERSGRAFRCCSPPDGSCRSTTSGPRRGARPIRLAREDVLEIHPHDAEERGVRDGDWVRLRSRPGRPALRAAVTDRVAPGVVYTTFHHPVTQANVVTTDYSDWATNCPEYKVTAVQVSPSNGPIGLAARVPGARRSAAAGSRLVPAK